MTFKTGDVVVLKSGGDTMAVVRVAGDEDEYGVKLCDGFVETRWMRAGQANRGIFEVEILKLAEAQENQ